MSLTKSTSKATVGINATYAIDRIRLERDGAGTITKVNVYVPVSYDDGSRDQEIIDVLPLLTSAQQTSLIKELDLVEVTVKAHVE